MTVEVLVYCSMILNLLLDGIDENKTKRKLQLYSWRGNHRNGSLYIKLILNSEDYRLICHLQTSSNFNSWSIGVRIRLAPICLVTAVRV